MVDEIITTNQQWYDLTKYKDEVQQFVKLKKNQLDVSSKMEQTYNQLYRQVFAGTEEGDVERFPVSTELFKVYKSTIIESCLSGYSALLEINGNDAESMLKVPELKQTMIEQFKSDCLLEDLSNDTLDDWILKGEAVTFIKLKEDVENYRIKETIYDEETGKPLIKFSMKEGVSTKSILFDRIDPLDFFVDALDYKRDPMGCTKIIRSWIDAKTLLSSNTFPLLTKDDKEAIVNSVGRNGKGGGLNWFSGWSTPQAPTYNSTDKDRIEVLTFFGDFITSDNKVLNNIKAILVNNRIAYLDYNTVSTQRIVYAPYFIDRMTHRGISPIACGKPVNRLLNKATDMFIQNLEDISVPIMLYQKGSITAQQAKEVRNKRECEYNDLGAKPEFWAPPAASQAGLQLLDLILNQSKNVLGLNSYMAGDTSGAVRTARESAILTQKANARMRVETDVFSYKFLLPLFTCFYTFNRELALAAQEPLAPIYSDPTLNVSISTNASRADKEGELNRLMEMLNLPIAQMIFSNLNPEQVTMAVRYLMAKAELSDVDNLLELMDSEGNPQYPTVDQDGNPVEGQQQEVPQSEGGSSTPSRGGMMPQGGMGVNNNNIPNNVPINELLQ